MTATPQKITVGEMRASGVRDVLIYCRDHRCSHHVAISTDRWPDNIRLSDIEPGFVCTVCGKRGAEVRPKLVRCRAELKVRRFRRRSKVPRRPSKR